VNETPAPAAPLRLVLVEDNPGDALLVREMLRDAFGDGADVSRFATLAEAGGYLQDHGADCLLLDLSLPDAEGLEAVLDVRRVAPTVPVVVLSGLDDETVAVRAVQEGAQDYLIKGSVDGNLIGRAIRYAIERKRSQLELARLALHDQLTGLPNRSLFLDHVRLALARLERHPSTLAVLFLDLDGFKAVNDELGHQAGDSVLVEVARRITGVVRHVDTVARFGGDEFMVLCEEISDREHAAELARRVAEAVVRPLDIGGAPAGVSASIGIALCDRTNCDADQLLRDADAAMYRAKQAGKSRYEFAA
jgi:diguanylate cyclase (GGDEF)-like protein